MDHITQHLHIIPPIIIPPNMVLHHIYTLVDLPMGLHHHQTVLTVILVDQFIHKDQQGQIQWKGEQVDREKRFRGNIYKGWKRASIKTDLHLEVGPIMLSRKQV